MSSWVFSRMIPGPDSLNFATVREYIRGEQNFEKGISLVSVGAVRNYVPAKRGTTAGLNCWVMAEMQPSVYYKVEIHFSPEMGSSCVCGAHGHTHARCKHQAAAFLGLIVLRDHYVTSEDAPMPEWFKAKSRLRFWDPGSLTHQKLFGSWTMFNIVKNMTIPLPLVIDNRKIELKNQVASQERKKKNYCFCLSENHVSDEMIRCAGCKDYFHHICIRNHGTPSFNPQVYSKKHPFYCINCKPSIPTKRTRTVSFTPATTSRKKWKH